MANDTIRVTFGSGTAAPAAVIVSGTPSSSSVPRNSGALGSPSIY